MHLGLAIVAILFPPLAVFLRRGWSFHLIVNVVLTLTLWIPGLVHALVNCVKDEVVDPTGPLHGHGPGETHEHSDPQTGNR